MTRNQMSKLVFVAGSIKSLVSLRSAVDRLFGYSFSKAYMNREGLTTLLRSGEANEIPIDWRDLAQLHRIVMKRKPNVVLEFGVGFSTIVIAHALAKIGYGKLYSVDANLHWLENTKKKLGALATVASLSHSGLRVVEVSNQLTSRYESLPNIVPDFVYLDGPSPSDVEGSIDGLSFKCSDETYRHPVSSDLLLLESTLMNGAYVFVDRRYVNVQFLKNNFKRNWKISWDRIQHQVGFELCEITGMSRTKASDSH